MNLDVREIGADEFDLVWPIFHAVVAAGDTYSYAPDTSFAEARAMWTTAPTRCFVASIDGAPAGCYMLKPNQPGLGSHVANTGYMVAPHARGQGLAGKLCEHSLATARAAGFLAMQFNFVVSTNERAVRLWESLGFAIVGRLPLAFRHPSAGYVDAFVMYQEL